MWYRAVVVARCGDHSGDWVDLLPLNTQVAFDWLFPFSLKKTSLNKMSIFLFLQVISRLQSHLMVRDLKLHSQRCYRIKLEGVSSQLTLAKGWQGTKSFGNV